ncbi:uncharacterized protein LOC120298745 isoform X2 [Crotalus tigris]|uniref:uncharacterized protein LOC120298745 isoform X2 n=1 Tax=Crotalus tigris TaxID=88082 RepID=UPI00192F1E1F|nr:uncharacterized protein LOC120298745 isoform X2 [Crotalus tigris]
MPPKGQPYQKRDTSVNIFTGVWSSIVYSKIWWSPYYQNIYCLLCCINFMLLMIFMATPIWLRQNSTKDYTFIGIWSICDELSCKDLSLPEEAHLDTIRFFVILAFIFTLLAFISSQDFISRLVDTKITEDMISSASNFFAGIFLMSLLLIVHFRLRTVLDDLRGHIRVWWGFIGNCIICVHCFVLEKKNKNKQNACSALRMLNFTLFNPFLLRKSKKKESKASDE